MRTGGWCAVVGVGLVMLLGLATARADEGSRVGEQLWLYCPVNLLVPEQLTRVEGLMERAARAGYTHLLVTDSKFSRLHEMPKSYFEHVARLREKAAAHRLTIVPAVFPVGYSNDILSRDPNLAEGLPVRDALMIVRGDEAVFEPEAQVGLPEGNDRRAWSMSDAAWQWRDGA